MYPDKRLRELKMFSFILVNLFCPGISNVVAIETSNDNSSAGTLGFVHAFYCSLARGHTLQDSFEEGKYR